jgi:hypothetical protein
MLIRRAFRVVRQGIALMLLMTALGGTSYGWGGPSGGGPSGGDPAVPEIDSGTLTSAMALLGGGALMLSTRRQRQ